MQGDHGAVMNQSSQTEFFPTDARMRQKEKHAQMKEITGEKHQPKKKAQKMHPGKDDCGEDFSSLERMTGKYGLAHHV